MMMVMKKNSSCDVRVCVCASIFIKRLLLLGVCYYLCAIIINRKFYEYTHSERSAFGGNLIKSVSNSSINCSFKTRTFDPAYLLYSSKIDVRFQPCIFRKHPITAPVRCDPNCENTSTG